MCSLPRPCLQVVLVISAAGAGSHLAAAAAVALMGVKYADKLPLRVVDQELVQIYVFICIQLPLTKVRRQPATIYTGSPRRISTSGHSYRI